MYLDYLSDLAIFQAVSEERSFTRASVRFGISQSALSHRMRRLEDALGVRLLTRTTRNVAPTEAGERLLGKLVPAIGSIDRELTLLGELRDKPSGTIRITTSKHAATTVLWPKLNKVLSDYPDVHIELSIDSGLADVVSDRFDAGVRLGEALEKDMIAVRISPELKMAVVGSPDYFRRHPIPATPQDLSQHNCISQRRITSGGLYAWELEQNGREVKVRVDGQLTFNDDDMILQAALDGGGLAFLMNDLIEDSVSQGRLVRVLEDWCEPFSGYHLYYPSRLQPSAAFKLVVDALRHR
ncbi:LysR family transcriptional regulator [Rhizobium leguminosarum bv. viciae]|uniref:LysR family transcriptional regulator n=1 Tax=Rhizobium leguminosarum TaxID=384 RepID=UPI0014412769|nr:LysR family transcriptional regulator [Rhizobium leguminosarum]NKJ94699.1 LysR family transcriptional regulator [Rhizobium leguminosarum bv. viciae]NKK87487.1 LysR family transcriptional regulator [Rhizobium leguminosarum bv. viciae]